MVFWSGGVMKGSTMLKGWKEPNKAKHEEAEKLPENQHFYSWYNEPQDLSGAWYLWAIEHIFKGNKLPKMLDIKCPVNVVVGLKDPITPPAQAIAVQKNCSEKITVYTTKGGHIGLFISRRAIEDHWSKLFKAASKLLDGEQT
jgi:poly(3-hydroxyalkanoate) synthetase